MRPGPSEFERRRAADAARGTGDDGCFLLKVQRSESIEKESLVKNFHSNPTHPEFLGGVRFGNTGLSDESLTLHTYQIQGKIRECRTFRRCFFFGTDRSCPLRSPIPR